MDRVSNRLQLFKELVSCSYNIHLWEYDKDMNLISSDCSNESSLHMIFTLQNTKEYIKNYILSNRLPIVFSNNLNLTWVAVFESVDGYIEYIHLFGPVFTDEISRQDKRIALEKHTLSVSSKLAFLSQLESLPVIPATQFLQYAIMLHCCVTKEKIHISDFCYYNTDIIQKSNSIDAQTAIPSDRRLSYLYEQQMLKIVENGNIDYLNSEKKSAYLGQIGKLSLGNPLRQAQNMCNIYTALCTRAAICGGISPEIAYTLSDNYIQSCESCKLPTEVFYIIETMFTDFVKRVHECKLKNGCSPLIKSCQNYIELYLESGLTLESLANHTGYSQNYLGVKFKSEMGISLKEYINQMKGERAKLLLASTHKNISDISECLGFCSTSYFTKIFHELTGIPPTEYRANHAKENTNEIKI